jgi:hypothetical protein
MYRSMLALALFTFASYSAMAQPATSTRPLQSLRDVVQGIGDRYNCYFSIEYSITAGRIQEGIEGTVADTSSAVPIRNELKALRRRFPDFDFVVDRYHDNVVHVVDRSVFTKANYVLTQRVREFNFDGPVNDLLKEIKKKVVGISNTHAGDTRELRLIDFSSTVHVRVGSMSVRELLTDAIFPNKHDSRILWIAETQLDYDGLTTIRFLR